MKHLLLTTIAAVVLVGCGPSTPDISIHDAATDGNIEAVKQHLATGVDVNANGDVYERTPLHPAANNGHTEVVELLIANNVDVNAKDEFGYFPLLVATNKETAELLIANGADVNAKFNGETPLDWTTHPDNPNKNKAEIADLLRKHGGKTGEELKAEGK